MAKVTLSDLSKVFKDDKKPSDFHYYGQIVSVDAENRTYEVSINRDENITVEAARLVGAHVGDTVMVTVMANGYATVTGRVGGDTDASDAQAAADAATEVADTAIGRAQSALTTAGEAQTIANNAKTLAESAEAEAGRAQTAAETAQQNAQASQTAAETAQQNAQSSQTAAETAQQNAQASQTAAETAQQNAQSSQTAAEAAAADAGIAKQSAENASGYAARALGNLSTVQSVTETLNWITAHGTMTQTTDTELDPSHVYFTQDENGDYVVGNVHYSIVAEPKKSDLSTYYVLSIDESLNNYVATHLALTDEGLWVLSDTNGWRLLVAGDGVSIIDSQGKTVAQYRSTITLGANDGNQLRLTPDAVAFVIAGQTIAYIEQDKLMTTNAELSGALFVGDYYVRQKSNGKLAVGLRR